MGTNLPSSAQQQTLTSGHVKDAVHKAVAYLKSQQNPDGSWVFARHRTGVTALCTLALLNAGVASDDPVIRRGINFLNRTRNQNVYATSLKAQVYATAGPKRYRPQLQKAVNYLIAAQKTGGMWSYKKGNKKGSGDNSNTQFALLGLHQAATSGVPIKRAVWQRSKKHFCDTQNFDGGWGYTPGSASYGSMTTAGLASLYICGQRLMTGRKIFRNGA